MAVAAAASDDDAGVVAGGERTALTTTTSTTTITTTSSSKKKKKKSGSSSATPLLKPQILAPHDAPLRLLSADPCPDDFVPRKFTAGGGAVGSEYLLSEIDRLLVHANKQCGGADVAMELQNKLSFFPPQLQWVFLMHLAKNPFTDHPHSLINLWHDIPMPAQKQERVGLIVILLDWIIALYRLNDVWRKEFFDNRSAQCTEAPPQEGEEEGADSDANKDDHIEADKGSMQNTSANAKMRQGKKKSKYVNATNSPYSADTPPSTFRPPGLCKEVCSFPRMLIGTIRRPRHSMADKLRLEAGLCWGSGEVTITQQLWIQAWWAATHMICYGCRLAYLLANSSDKSDLRCLVEQFRASGCADVLIDRPAFGSYVSVCKDDSNSSSKSKGGFPRIIESSALAHAIDSELAEIFEDLNWAEVDDLAKLRCVMMFSDFLCRGWTLDPSVLTLVDRAELKAFPLVLQFTVMQQLSFAHSRLHQEALVWIIRLVPAYHTAYHIHLLCHPL
jgi:hypothetical protein